MAKATAEVLIGTGTLYTAPTGTAFPADPTVTPAVTWVDIGYSEEGWSLNIERDVEDIFVAEEIDSIDTLATGRNAHIVGDAVQGSLTNLKTALAGGTIATDAGPPATSTYTPAGTTTLDEVAVLLRTKAPNDKVRDIQVPFAVAVGAVEMASRKAPDKTVLSMDFKLIKKTGSELFEIVDTTA